MTNIYSPAELSALLKQHGIAPLKSLGQNFLIDQNVVEKIAQAAVEPGGNVLEVGPGPGALTLQLARRAGKVVAIEIDRGMLGVLEESLAGYEQVQVLHADFLKVDLEEISRTYFGGQPFSVAGNLPYYITAKCILKVLESPVQAQRFTAMVQQEVAERLVAQPGDKNYCFGSVLRRRGDPFPGGPAMLYAGAGSGFGDRAVCAAGGCTGRAAGLCKNGARAFCHASQDNCQ